MQRRKSAWVLGSYTSGNLFSTCAQICIFYEFFLPDVKSHFLITLFKQDPEESLSYSLLSPFDSYNQLTGLCNVEIQEFFFYYFPLNQWFSAKNEPPSHLRGHLTMSRVIWALTSRGTLMAFSRQRLGMLPNISYCTEYPPQLLIHTINSCSLQSVSSAKVETLSCKFTSCICQSPPWTKCLAGYISSPVIIKSPVVTFKHVQVHSKQIIK